MATIPLPEVKEPDIYSYGFDKLLYRDPPRQDEFLTGGDLDSQFGIYDGGVSGGYGSNIKFTNIGNTFAGVGSGKQNSGDRNTGLGESALLHNTSGKSNTGLGCSALANNLSGQYNVAVGSQALLLNITSYNTAIGYRALVYTTSGQANTAVGDRALYTNSTAFYNVAMGHLSLYNNNAEGNTGVGEATLFDNTTGQYNSALGIYALYGNISGNNNTGIGGNALASNETGSGNIGIGYYAGRFETGSDAFYVNNQNRTNTAGDKAKSILYGVMAADPANQKLTINALLNQSITKTPAAANATGTKGDICWDASYIYICVDTDTWERVGIATW